MNIVLIFRIYGFFKRFDILGPIFVQYNAGRFKERSTLIFALVSVALTIPLGFYNPVRQIHTRGLAVALSRRAVYLGTTHLLPRTEHEHKRIQFVVPGGGFLWPLIVVSK